MLSTNHKAANILADLLLAHGINDVIMSPGSRNTPLILAISRRKEFDCKAVIDERSAAFIALGMSVERERPVAIVCTSGSALLNYAPAVAEAFYRQIPLIVVSADRPVEWIDQDDSQTIWQQNALEHYVKRSCDISAHIGHPTGEWAASRLINDALIEASAGRRGPVHINIRFDSPLNELTEVAENSSPVIKMLSPACQVSENDVTRLAGEIANTPKVMVIAGFNPPDASLCKSLETLSSQENIIVMTETISNLRSAAFITRIDGTLCRMTQEELATLAPELVITVGGALVSRHVKDWLRDIPGLRHWHVGENHTTVDCFKHLALRINAPAKILMSQLADAIGHHRNSTADSGYGSSWRCIASRAAKAHEQYLDSIPWSTMKAFGMIISEIPVSAHLHLSNGTSVRYAQLMDCSHVSRTECNRGVSGIDGCTSTALGASLVYEDGDTVLVTGDMSMQYDIAALSSFHLTPRLKIIVICNNGGEIFRFIKSTSTLPELEKYFATGVRLPLRQLSEAYGCAFFEADDCKSLATEIRRFFDERTRPAILAVNTPPIVSAEILKNYFSR